MNAVHETVAPGRPASWRAVLDQILEKHHAYLRAAVPHLEHLLDHVARERLLPIEFSDRLQREFTVLADLLDAHCSQQEVYLFPRVYDACLAAEERGAGVRPEAGLAETLAEEAGDNQEILDRARRFEQSLADVARQGYGPLLEKVIKPARELQHNLEQHLGLENSVLFPLAQKSLHVEA